MICRHNRRLLNLTHLADGGFGGCLVRLTFSLLSAVEVSVFGSYLGDFWPHDGRTIALVRVSSVIVMVFLLSDEEIDGLFDGSRNGVVVDVAHVGDHGLGLDPLVIGQRHDA